MDAAPDMADNYEEGDMAEWYSLFGHYGSLLDAPIIPDVFEEKEEEIEEAVDDVELPIQELIRFWVRICSDKENRIDASGIRAVRECLDMFLERVLKLANEESLRRTCNEPNRVLVPALVEGIIPKCSYLEFISNSGLLKPEHIDWGCLFSNTRLSVRLIPRTGGMKSGGNPKPHLRISKSANAIRYCMDQQARSSPVKTFSFSQYLLEERYNYFDNRPSFSWYPLDSSPNSSPHKPRRPSI